MKSLMVVAGILGMAVLAGCSTTKAGSCSSLENRVQALETKIQNLETDTQPSQSFDAGIDVLSGKADSGITVENMTKTQIQEALKNAGYYDGAIDGKIGPKTRAAIVEFQAGMGLKADGIAGRNTKEKLLKYLE